jgi:hypothetical protein
VEFSHSPAETVNASAVVSGRPEQMITLSRIGKSARSRRSACISSGMVQRTNSQGSVSTIKNDKATPGMLRRTTTKV